MVHSSQLRLLSSSWKWILWKHWSRKQKQSCGCLLAFSVFYSSTMLQHSPVILRQRGWWWVDIPGLSMVWVYSMYGDTQTERLVMGGYPWIIQDGLGILDVWGYSDWEVDDRHTSMYYSAFISVWGYSDTCRWMSLGCPGILVIQGYYTGVGKQVDIPRLSRMIWVPCMYGNTQIQGYAKDGSPRIVKLSMVYGNTNTQVVSLC